MSQEDIAEDLENNRKNSRNSNDPIEQQLDTEVFEEEFKR